MLLKNIRLGLFLFAALPWVAVACLGASPETSTPEVISVGALVSPSGILTVGDIGADDPGGKIKRFQPLADYLVGHLELYGYQKGRLVVTKNMEDMGSLLKDGPIDIYMGSPYPTLALQELSDSELSASKAILRCRTGSVRSNSRTDVGNKPTGTEKGKDLLGKSVALDKPLSPSGCILLLKNMKRSRFDLPPGESEAPFAGLRDSMELISR